METYTAPVNVWNKDSIRPGPVGSVGDCLIGVRFKQSAPELAERWDGAFSGKNEVYFGSNVSDGYHAGFTSGGGVAKTLVKRMPYRQGFKTPVGWIKEDIVPTDRSRTALMGSVGQYSWDAQVGRLDRAKTTGDFFTPLPGGYLLGAGQVPRGSQVPRILAESSGEGIALPPTEVNITDPDFGERGSINNPQGNQPQEPGFRKVYLFPDVHWVPQGSNNLNIEAPNTYPYYIRGYLGGSYYPNDDPTIKQEVKARGGNGGGTVGAKFGNGGVLNRPASAGEAPFKYVKDVPRENTPVGGPIQKPGGYRDPKEIKQPPAGKNYFRTARVR